MWIMIIMVQIDQKMDLAELEDPVGINQVDDVAISMFTAIIQKIADARAENGAEQQRIQTSYALHSSNLVTLRLLMAGLWMSMLLSSQLALQGTMFWYRQVHP